MAVGLDRGRQFWGDGAAAGDEDQHRGRQRILEVGEKGCHLVGGEPADIPHHHDAPLRQKGRGGATIGHPGQVHLIAAEVLDGEVPPSIAGQLGDLGAAPPR